MAASDEIVFLLDVDNTLFDNDRFQADLMRHFAEQFGTLKRDRYAELIEELRTENGYVDYLGALQRFRLSDMNNMQLLSMSSFLMDYPFNSLVYPGAFDVITYLDKWGKTVILSDGDVIFQPRKIKRSGLWQAVQGRVSIYVHKEQMLDEVAQQYPARHYVMVDDKVKILQAMKALWGEKLTTVFPIQGHYALSAINNSSTAKGTTNTFNHALADMTIERIGDLVNHDFFALCDTSSLVAMPLI